MAQFTKFLQRKGENLVAMEWKEDPAQTGIEMSYRRPRSGDWGTQADAGPAALADAPPADAAPAEAGPADGSAVVEDVNEPTEQGTTPGVRTSLRRRTS